MGYYSVVVHGTGIRFALKGSDEPVVGFYAVRAVRASSEADAGAKAIRMLEQSWNVAPLADGNQGKAPSLCVESCAGISVIRWLWTQNTGHIFYQKGGVT